MTTLTVGGEEIAVQEVDQIGGVLGNGAEFTDILWRDRRGRYYLEEERAGAVPPNAVYTLPRDRAWLDRVQRPRRAVRAITERAALLWKVREFTEDPILERRLRKAVAALFMQKRAGRRVA